MKQQHPFGQPPPGQHGQFQAFKQSPKSDSAELIDAGPSSLTVRTSPDGAWLLIGLWDVPAVGTVEIRRIPINGGPSERITEERTSAVDPFHCARLLLQPGQCLGSLREPEKFR
jgi:hypothetical protein